jgi:hypothetical protein
MEVGQLGLRTGKGKASRAGLAWATARPAWKKVGAARLACQQGFGPK